MLHLKKYVNKFSLLNSILIAKHLKDTLIAHT